MTTSSDVVGRWGGDEFIVGLPGARRAIAEARMGELQEYLRRRSFTGPSGERLRISFSVGVAEFPTDGGDLEALYRVADAGMYRAKRGRGGDLDPNRIQSGRTSLRDGRVQPL